MCQPSTRRWQRRRGGHGGGCAVAGAIAVADVVVSSSKSSGSSSERSNSSGSRGSDDGRSSSSSSSTSYSFCGRFGAEQCLAPESSYRLLLHALFAFGIASSTLVRGSRPLSRRRHDAREHQHEEEHRLQQRWCCNS